MKNPFDAVRLRMPASPFQQKAMLVWAVKYAAVFFIFLVFFVPIQSRQSEVSKKRALIQSQITEIQKLSLDLMTPKEFSELEKTVAFFESGLMDLSKASAILDMVSESAEKNHFNLIQIYSDAPLPVEDNSGKDLEARGKKVLLLPVTFRAETDYKNFAQFLRELRWDAGRLFVVESLKMQQPSPGSDILQCDVTLGFFVQ